MRAVKLTQAIESTYKVKTIIIISFVLTFFISEQYLVLYNFGDFLTNFVFFFTTKVTLSFYGAIIGLLLTAYTVLIGFVPNFTGDSLKMPIFGQINRLFLFTILDGIMLMILNFTQGILPVSIASGAGVISFQGIPIFLDVVVFFFIALMIGLIFCVLTLSQIFNLLRTRGEKRNSKNIEVRNSGTKDK
jgi:hypothetical protein